MARLIALFLFTIYVLTYSGAIHSGDEIAIVAVTDNLLARGRFDTNLNIWGRYGQPYAAGVPDHFGPSGDLYTKKGIAQSLVLAPLFALSNGLPHLGRIHLATLTYGLVTALTGALIFRIGRRLGYRPAVAATAALAFGLTTPAWVYARYLFGEPLIGFAVVVWLYALTRIAEGSGQPERWLALSSLMIGIAAATNLINILLVPLLVLGAFVALRGRLSARQWLALMLPVLLVGLGIGALNAIRFGSPFDAGQNPQYGEGFNMPLHIGLYGLLISPARGLLIHSPSVVLGVAGWFGLRRRHPVLAWSVAGLTAIYLGAYGLYFAWWAGYCWGPRYLLPLTVPAAVAALPLFGWLLTDAHGNRRRIVGGATLLLLGLSFLIQVLGVVVPFGAYEVELTERYGFDQDPPILYQYGTEVMRDWSLSPVLGHARLLRDKGITDISWFTADGVDWAALIPLGASTLLLARLLVRASRRGRAPALKMMAVLGALTVALTGWAMVRNADHPLEAAQQPHPALDLIAEEAAPDDGVVIYVPELTKSILNNYPAFPAAWGMPPLVAPNPDLEGAMATAQVRHDRLWVVSWFDRMEVENAWVEARLAGEHYALGARRQAQEGGYWIGRYLMRRAAEDWQPAGWTLAESIRLKDFAVSPAAPQPGDTLRLALRWEALTDVTGDYVIFVHVVDPDDQVVTQADHAPQNTFRPTWGWKANETIADRVALSLDGLTRGVEYTVQVGIYDWREPEVRLSGETPDGETIDAFTVMQFTVP